MLVRATADLDEFRDVLPGDLDISNIEVKGEENSEQIRAEVEDNEQKSHKANKRETRQPKEMR